MTKMKEDQSLPRNQKGEFHYTECGLSNVWLCNGYEVKETPYGDAVAIHDIEGLHHTIGLYLINHKHQLTGEEVRFLRKELDLPQSQLAILLNASTDSVRGWEHDRTLIQGSADRILRLLYKEAVTGAPDGIRGDLERIAQINRDMHIQRMEFEEREGGWRPAA